jgi:16S rRNA C967 or C1407 C5-methylase (RsmB/RsmF family)
VKPLCEQELGSFSPEIAAVEWLEGMHSLPANVKISSNELYRSGMVYGIDLSSAAAVHAMGIGEGDFRVLELCCAPGAKLTYIADLLKVQPSPELRKVIGVDINKNRLNITHSIVSKYNLEDMVELI